MKTVAVLTGSLRRDSLNRKFAEALARQAGDRLEFRFVDIDLPLYNEDLWETPPEKVLAMKAAVEEADAVLMVTPEYNRFFSPALKNAIDWGTRPRGRNSWAGKPAAAIGSTPGALGALAAVLALSSQMSVVGMTVMAQPGVYMSLREDSFDAGGGIADPGTRGFLDSFLDAFADWAATKG
ncbi:NADPH-dependent FMN reductase [Poseidonocella sp. HB161398]|uniref:NADPH-dependent FMN reductase n=1 Tax=Poseidonocella sp. HB161398 TaxID=2320855 RepID=UPI0011089468|nr:NAD(P)H-dependent oxidoreductase [Poseidonocella sp. HB161398]